MVLFSTNQNRAENIPASFHPGSFQPTGLQLGFLFLKVQQAVSPNTSLFISTHNDLVATHIVPSQIPEQLRLMEPKQFYNLLEPSAVKVARSVLRGEGNRKVPDLPDHLEADHVAKVHLGRKGHPLYDRR